MSPPPGAGTRNVAAVFRVMAVIALVEATGTEAAARRIIDRPRVRQVEVVPRDIVRVSSTDCQQLLANVHTDLLAIIPLACSGTIQAGIGDD
ncbi:MAG: hypothetical protein ABI716_03325 [Candidatus Saccharibacteria bacterium]